MLGALMFHSWEGWDLISSAYFCFITLTTVNTLVWDEKSLLCHPDWFRGSGADKKFLRLGAGRLRWQASSACCGWLLRAWHCHRCHVHLLHPGQHCRPVLQLVSLPFIHCHICHHSNNFQRSTHCHNCLNFQLPCTGGNQPKNAEEKRGREKAESENGRSWGQIKIIFS